MYIELTLEDVDKQLRPCVTKAVHIAHVTATPVRFRWLNALTVTVEPRESVDKVIRRVRASEASNKGVVT